MKNQLKILLGMVCILLLTAACQTTPDQLSVREKDDEKLQELITITNQNDPYQAPGTVFEQIESATGDLVITIDAKLFANDNGSYPVYSLKPRDLTDAATLLDAFIGENPLYATDDSMLVITKDFLDQRILEFKALLANADDAATKQELQLQIDMWEAEYATAKDSRYEQLPARICKMKSLS